MRPSMLLGGVAIIATVILDQLSKWIVIETLGPNGSRDVVDIVPGVLRFIYVRNTGSAFGLFQGSSEILRVLAVVAIVALIVFYVRSAARDRLLALALGLQLGGAVGNIIDRYRFGYVVDWIDVSRWPTFNVADSAITVGVTLMLFGLLFRDDGSAQRSIEERRDRTTIAAGDDA